MHVAAAPIIFLVTFAFKGPGFQKMEACSLLVNLRKGMQSSSEGGALRDHPNNGREGGQAFTHLHSKTSY